MRLDVQVQLAEICCTRGEIEARDRQPERARGYYERAEAIHQKRLKNDPTDEPTVAYVADSLRRIGTTFQASGRPADAVAHDRRSIAILEGLKKPRAVDYYDEACCHSLIAGSAAEVGSGVSAAEGSAEAELAVAGVRRAFKAGYGNLRWARSQDLDLDPIRSRSDFQSLIMDLSLPAQPFAALRP
jgi:hypothetical protein